MPRQRSPDSKKAETLFHKGMKLSEIAEKLGVPAGTVRRWKRDQKWGEKSTGKRSDSSAETERKMNENRTLKPNTETERSASSRNKKTTKLNECARKPGAPRGNVNALGNEGGPPLYNKNAEKHGAYSRVYRDVFTDEEDELADAMDMDAEALLDEEIRALTIRSRRLFDIINRLRKESDPTAAVEAKLTVSTTMVTEHMRVFDGTEEEKRVQEEEYKRQVQKKIDNEERMPGREINIITTSEDKTDKIMRIERELTSIQSQKGKLIHIREQIRAEKAKLSGSDANTEIANAWIEGILGKVGDTGG